MRSPYVLAILLPVCLLSSCITSAPAIRGESHAIPLWGRWEGTFVAHAPPAEVTLQVTLIAPSGARHRIDGFWDGGTTWRARFMPDEEGLWQYETHSTPFAAGLSGRSGTFICFSHAATPNPLLRHGPVRAAPDGPHFIHEDGTPFLWIGDTAWNGALRSMQSDWELYLANRRTRRFSVIQLVTTQWRAAHTDRRGMRAYTGYDRITIHPEFFQRLDVRIDAINRAGLLAAPVILWALGDAHATPGHLPESQAIKLARYIVARYGAHHVAWFLGGDGDYRDENAARWKRIGRAVFAEGTRAPVFLHPGGMHWPWEAFREETWLSAIGYQSGHGDDEASLRWIYAGPHAQAWQTYGNRPVVNLEPPYEGIRAYQSGQAHTAYTVRRAVYWSLLSTAIAGVSYGAHGVWSWETEPGVPLNHPNSGVAPPWYEAIHLPGAGDMSRLAELFGRLRWWRLRPDPLLIRAGPAAPSHHVAAARTPDGRTAVLYLPRGGEVALDQGRVSAQATPFWFNPRDGRQSAATPVGNARYAAPDTLDWVLVLSDPSR